jgi:CheY-like chemotaxis protein
MTQLLDGSRLPDLPRGTAVPPQADRAASQICAGLVFLVAEDHEFQRGVIVRLLRRLGAQAVHAFDDGASALAAALELRTPAILVLDLAMPGLNGMEVMRIAGLQQLPLAVIVNSASSDDLVRCVDAARAGGATVLGVFSKPLTAAKLAPLLAQYRHDQRQDPYQPALGGAPGERRATKPDEVGPAPAASPVLP